MLPPPRAPSSYGKPASTGNPGCNYVHIVVVSAARAVRWPGGAPTRAYERRPEFVCRRGVRGPRDCERCTVALRPGGGPAGASLPGAAQGPAPCRARGHRFGYTAEEIAAELGVHPGTTNKRLHRGRGELRKVLGLTRR
ncbi:RNA polymerase sigma factor [Sorangium sp. So ce385]|uniref:RNA polymerase sigma factor n=1 Tax=Sorangium sp. So ce385 TaxID=3133308 RepID=UPI003F5CAE9B